MFASLVPGFPPRQASPYRADKKSDGRRDRTSKLNFDERDKKEAFEEQKYGQSIFHDASGLGPVNPVEIGPILPPQSGEKPLDNETIRFLETLLEFMVTQVWNCDIVKNRNFVLLWVFWHFVNCRWWRSNGGTKAWGNTNVFNFSWNDSKRRTCVGSVRPLMTIFRYTNRTWSYLRWGNRHIWTTIIMCIVKSCLLSGLRVLLMWKRKVLSLKLHQSNEISMFKKWYINSYILMQSFNFVLTIYFAVLRMMRIPNQNYDGYQCKMIRVCYHPRCPCHRIIQVTKTVQRVPWL